MPWSPKRRPLSHPVTVLVIQVLLAPHTAGAQHLDGRGAAPTLREVLATALAHNPDLLQADARVDSAGAEQAIARALPNPTYNGIPGTPYQYTVSEPVDLGPQRLYRTRASGEGRAATELDLADARRQVTFSVSQAFYDLLLADSLSALAAEQRDVVKRLLQADSVRLRAGDVAPRVVTRSELELARADAALARAEGQVGASRLGLQVLMGAARPDTAFRVSGALSAAPQSLPLDSLPAIALANRPDLAAASRRRAQSQSLKSLATSLLLPTPLVLLSYQPDGAFATGSHYSLGVGVQVPLFYWYGGERRRADASVEAATAAETRARTQLESDVAIAVAGYRLAQGIAARYEGGLLERARRALEDARYAYRAGHASQLDLLDAVRTWSGIRTEYLTALHDRWVSIAALSRAIGRDLVAK